MKSGLRRGVAVAAPSKLPGFSPILARSVSGQSLDRLDYGLRRTRTAPMMQAPDRISPGPPSSSGSPFPPRTDRLPSRARPESATAMSGGTAIDTSPSIEITLTFSCSPRTLAFVRSIRAQPANAMTSAPRDASQRPSRMEVPSSASTRVRRWLARTGGGRVAPGASAASRARRHRARRHRARRGRARRHRAQRPMDRRTSRPAIGGPAVGAPAVGAPAVGAPAVGAPAVGAPAVGAPAGGGPAVACACRTTRTRSGRQ